MSAFSTVRLINIVSAAVVLILFLVHAVGNALQFMYFGSVMPEVISYVMLAFIVIHIVCGCILFARTWKAQKSAGVSYWLANKRFWCVRITGIAVLLLIIFHLAVFWQFDASVVRLNEFGFVELTFSALFVLCLFLHVSCNFEPLAISLGIANPRGRAIDCVLVMCVLAMVMVVGFGVYWLRWSSI